MDSDGPKVAAKKPAQKATPEPAAAATKKKAMFGDDSDEDSDEGGVA